jgi:hypothetical protein
MDKDGWRTAGSLLAVFLFGLSIGGIITEWLLRAEGCL